MLELFFLYLHASVISGACAGTMVQVIYPDGQLSDQDMFIRGSGGGLNWEKGQPMTKQKVDTWLYCLPNSPQAPSQVEVKPLIADRTWSIGKNFVVSYSASTNVLYPWFFTTKGRYMYKYNVVSSQLDNTRDLVIYLPASFDENPFRVYDKVLLMHDGENLFNASTSFGGVAWRVQDALDELIFSGKIEPMVVVGVDNTLSRTYEYTYSSDPKYGRGGGADLYLDFLESTVLPLAIKQFRLNNEDNQLDVGMMGSSLGGLVTCYAAWTRPTVYKRVGCMSSSFWWNSQDFNSSVLNRAHPTTADMPSMYVDCGTEELMVSSSNLTEGRLGGDIHDSTVVVYNHLSTIAGLVPNQNLFYYLAEGGEHNEASWGKRVHIPLKVLYSD